MHGLGPLNLGQPRDGLLYVPPSYRSGQAAPLVLSLHGAGGSARDGLWPLRDLADEAGLIVLAPQSRGRTWDIILGSYGPDVEFLNLALSHVLGLYDVDEARLAIGGFSDGASYALSLGLINGDLFPSVIAFSPGFMAPTSQHGSPRFFVSHGIRDNVLPIDPCSRRIVPQLKAAGYSVEYHEFDGPHTVPPDIARHALSWLLASS